MPAYNEEKNIGTVIEQWYPVVERIGGESRLVILNDGSRDGTYEMIRKYQKKYERLIGIDKPNEGHGELSSEDIIMQWMPERIIYFRPIPMARHFLMNSGSSGKSVKHAGY